jgi:glutathione S-transferase
MSVESSAARVAGTAPAPWQLFIANKNYSSWSLRPWVLMRELGLAFEEVPVPFADHSAPNWERFRQFSPTGRVPCLRHGDTVVWDSLAIIEYLAEHHAAVWPQPSAARAWARCASAEMHSGFSALRQHCSMHIGYRIQMGELPAALRQDLARLDELWCEGLSRFGGPFLAGAAFSAVDAFFAPVAFRIQSYGLQLSEPAMAYCAHLLALPAMREWELAALAEPWSDPAHDADSLASGRLIEDRRHIAASGLSAAKPATGRDESRGAPC